MKGVVKIENNILSYTTDKNINKYTYFKTKSFKIKITQKFIVAICRTMYFDDEIYFFVFVNSNLEKGIIPIAEDLTLDSFLLLLEHFKLKQDDVFVVSGEEEVLKGKVPKSNYIVFPEDLRNKPLFKNYNFLEKSKLILFKLFKSVHLVDGILEKSVKDYLKN